MKRNKLIVMSIDALFDEDIPCIKELPNFNRLLKNSARVRGGMRGIYPALTYPSHVSMITGTYPERHHICPVSYTHLPKSLMSLGFMAVTKRPARESSRARGS